MKKTYIKLNIDDNHLSIGNIFRIVKELSKNKGGALQSEIFMSLFDIDSINDTTVNNYCVGCRSIGNDYIQIYLNKQKRYSSNRDEFVDNIIKLLEIIDSRVYLIDDNKINFINSNDSANKLAFKLYNIAKNDKYVNEDLIIKLSNYIKDNLIYDVLVECLLFAIIYKKQPLYEEELKKEVLENVLNDTSISSKDLQDYLTLKLKEGINYYHSLKNLANLNNAYALFELGCDEYYGYTYSYPRYDKAYEYLKKASDLNHASASFMIGNMFLDGLLGNKSNNELEIAYDYILKSYNLGNIAASNTLGKMYYNGIHPLEKNKEEAIKYFKEASNNDYAFAFNNLGKICEDDGKLDEAFEYYKKSALLGESWACNKMGEYYRNNYNMKDAFLYYNRALDNKYNVISYYAFYNLAKYFYLNGCEEIVFKDKDKAINYLDIASKHDILDASILLINILALDYINSKDINIFNRINDLKLRIESNSKYNDDIRIKIDKCLEYIKDNKGINLDILG